MAQDQDRTGTEPEHVGVNEVVVFAHCPCGHEWVATFEHDATEAALPCPSCGCLNPTDEMLTSLRYIVDVPAAALDDFLEFTATHGGVGYRRMGFDALLRETRRLENLRKRRTEGA